MIGMHFAAFLTLALISLIAALVLHYGVRYRFLTGIDGFFAKWITAWLGAWVASAVLGNWFSPVRVANVYVIPAFVGAFALAFAGSAAWKARTRAGMAMSSEVVESLGERVTQELRDRDAALSSSHHAA